MDMVMPTASPVTSSSPTSSPAAAGASCESSDTAGMPSDVDREFFVSFMVLDEFESVLLDKNVDYFLNSSGGLSLDAARRLVQDADFQESLAVKTINGLLYSNIPNLAMNQYERVRWYVSSLGSQEGVHTVHWHGNTLLQSGHRVDTVGVLPAQSIVADMNGENPGLWMLHCHVNHHIHGGMQALYRVYALLVSPDDGVHTHLMMEHNQAVGITLVVLFVPIPMTIFFVWFLYCRRKHNQLNSGYSERITSAKVPSENDVTSLL
jgi:hypothetical protein